VPAEHPTAPPARDPAGFAAFYEQQFDAVLGFVTRRVDNAHLAADLTADIFVAALEGAHTYDARRGADDAAGVQQAASAPHSTAGAGLGASTAPIPQGTSGTSGLNIVNADYAVQSKPGGMVSVQLFDLKGVSGLQAVLDKAGIPAKVMVPSASCHTTGHPDSSPHGSLLKVAPPSGFHRNGVRDIKPSAIVPGDHLLFIANSKSGPATLLAITLVHRLPSCIPANQPPAGRRRP